jgi:hypothetical protein
MKKSYYFLATILPPIVLGEVPEMSFSEFTHLLQVNLSPKDLEKANVIRRFYDIQNIRAFWKKEELDPRGNFDGIELEEALLAREGFPEYVYDFLDRYDNTSNRLEHFPGLLADYYNHEIPAATGFLKEYLTFERDWRLVLTGFRAKQLGRDLAAELQFEDPNDDLVAQILAQKDSPSFVPPDGYEDLKPFFEQYGNQPLELYQALCEYRFRRIESMLEMDLFSIDRILGYMAELITAEKWIELDQQKGKEIANRVLKEEK